MAAHIVIPRPSSASNPQLYPNSASSSPACRFNSDSRRYFSHLQQQNSVVNSESSGILSILPANYSSINDSSGIMNILPTNYSINDSSGILKDSSGILKDSSGILNILHRGRNDLHSTSSGNKFLINPDDISSPSAGGSTWPPRSYPCSFCQREFRSAQALGGHMNVHRRDRARLRQSSPTSADEDIAAAVCSLSSITNSTSTTASPSVEYSTAAAATTAAASTVPKQIPSAFLFNLPVPDQSINSNNCVSKPLSGLIFPSTTVLNPAGALSSTSNPVTALDSSVLQQRNSPSPARQRNSPSPARCLLSLLQPAATDPSTDSMQQQIDSGNSMPESFEDQIAGNRRTISHLKSRDKPKKKTAGFQPYTVQRQLRAPAATASDTSSTSLSNLRTSHGLISTSEYSHHIHNSAAQPLDLELRL